MRTLEEVIAALPPEEQQQIEVRYLELLTLEQLRFAAKQTQRQLAAKLGVGQDTISRLERRSDMLLSTMRQYVNSMGGELYLVAQFPNRPPVRIKHLTVDRLKRKKKAAAKKPSSRPRRPRA